MDLTSPACLRPQDDVRIAALDALSPVIEWIRSSGRSSEDRSSEEEEESAAVLSECSAAIRDAVRDVEAAHQGVDMAMRERIFGWLSRAEKPTS